MSTPVIGCDIGGANIKVADTLGQCAAIAFPMWIRHRELGRCMRELLRSFPVAKDTFFAITMTGELADCFATRSEGVAQIIDQLSQALPVDRTKIYTVTGQWFSIDQSVQSPWEVAASNWYALATWICTQLNASVDLVLDIGSTTVDIIPIGPSAAGLACVATTARTDRDRLHLGQLIYTGMQRTPVAAILNTLMTQRGSCPVMAERFATSDDAYILLGLVDEEPTDCDSADNRPRTKSHAHARMARMIGEDAQTLSIAETRDLALQVVEAQANQVADAIRRNLPSIRPARIAVAGHGRPLAERALVKCDVHRSNLWFLDEVINREVSRAAPARAVADLLASELANGKQD